tara:strand:- start:258 stop:482 length:225 start_codon:yes stop_codon:yes gene_type:complete
MIITITENTADEFRQAMTDSKSGGGQVGLTHTRGDTATVCRGFHIMGEYINLIKSDMSLILVEAGDAITYDDGK